MPESLRILSLIQICDLKGLDTISINPKLTDSTQRTELGDMISYKRDYLQKEIRRYNNAIEASRVMGLIESARSQEELNKIEISDGLTDENVRKDLTLCITRKKQNITIREKENQFHRIEFFEFIPLTFIPHDQDKDDRMENFYQIQQDFEDSSEVLYNSVYDKKRYFIDLVTGLTELYRYRYYSNPLNRYNRKMINRLDRNVKKELNTTIAKMKGEPLFFNPEEVRKLEWSIRGDLTEVPDMKELKHYQRTTRVKNEILKQVFYEALEQRENQILHGGDSIWIAAQISSIKDVVDMIMEVYPLAGWVEDIVIGPEVTNKDARDLLEFEITELKQHNKELLMYDEIISIYNELLIADDLKKLDAIQISPQITDKKNREDIVAMITELRKHLIRKLELKRMEDEIDRVEQDIESANTISALNKVDLGNMINDPLLVDGWRKKIEEKIQLINNDAFIQNQFSQRNAILFTLEELRKSFSLNALMSLKVPAEVTGPDEIQALSDAIHEKKNFITWQESNDKKIEQYKEIMRQ